MSGENSRAPPRSWGRALLAAFFAFDAIAALLAGGTLDAVWRLNPEAQEGFRQIGTPRSVILMVVVGSACAAAAYGLARGRARGRRLALVILLVNLLGDTATALRRHDPRTLIGLPIGGAMLFTSGEASPDFPSEPPRSGTAPAGNYHNKIKHHGLDLFPTRPAA